MIEIMSSILQWALCQILKLTWSLPVGLLIKIEQKRGERGNRSCVSKIPFWSMIVLKMLFTHHIFSPSPPSTLPPPTSLSPPIKITNHEKGKRLGKCEKMVNQILTTEYWEWIWTK